MAHRWAGWLDNPCCLKGANRFRAGIKSEMANKWVGWLHNPCRLWGPHHFIAGDNIRNGPRVGRLATQPLTPEGSPPL